MIDIYLPGAWKIAKSPKDAPAAVHLDSPDGKQRALVHVVRRRAAKSTHCLVTVEQLDKIKAAGISFVHFSTLPANEKALSGGPAHVFGDCVTEPGDTADEVKIYKPGKKTPEVIGMEVHP